MFYYIWWIPFAILMYSTIGYLSIRNSSTMSTESWSIPIILWMVGALPLWVFISSYYKSNELNFVGAIYDIILLLTFQITLICFGCTDRFSLSQWIGLSIICLGVIVFKIF